MPVRYTIDPERRVVFTVFEGDLGDEHLEDFWRRLAADPAFDPTLRQIIDASEVTGLQALTSSTVRRIAEASLFAPEARRAIVAPRPAVFGMARMFQAYRDSEAPIGVFRTLGEARAWIGLPAEEV